MSVNLHRRNVLNLYKIILSLHQRLPIDLKTLGDLYVKSEFKQHKNCSPELVPQFMQQWTIYATDLHKQLDENSTDSNSPKLAIGRDISTENLDGFSEDQVLQLIELMKETTKVNRQFNIKDKDSE